MKFDEPASDATDSESDQELLWECDQCAYRETRPEDQEPWLCSVCGYTRWSVVAG